MAKSIDDYLARVGRHLRLLPMAHREEELREMRTHLDQAVMAYRERGLSEEESKRLALQQFGAPGIVALKLAAAWGRGVLARAIRPVGVFALIFALFYSVPYVTGPLIAHLFGAMWQGRLAEIIPRHPMSPFGRAFLMAGAFGAYPLAAWALGFVYPKVGVRATGLATGLWLVISLAMNPHVKAWADGLFLVAVAFMLIQAPAAALGAWCRNRYLPPARA